MVGVYNIDSFYNREHASHDLEQVRKLEEIKSYIFHSARQHSTLLLRIVELGKMGNLSPETAKEIEELQKKREPLVTEVYRLLEEGERILKELKIKPKVKKFDKVSDGHFHSIFCHGGYVFYDDILNTASDAKKQSDLWLSDIQGHLAHQLQKMKSSHVSLPKGPEDDYGLSLEITLQLAKMDLTIRRYYEVLNQIRAWGLPWMDSVKSYNTYLEELGHDIQ